VKRPSLGAIAVGCLPLFAVCFTVPLWDRVYPMVMGLPFNLFWLILWILVTPLIMGIAYRLESRRNSGRPAEHRNGGVR